MSEETNAIRERAVDWLRHVQVETDLSWTRLAKLAGVSVSTLTRQVNDPNYPHTPSTRTITRISSATGIAAPDLTDGSEQKHQLFEPEAAPFAFDAPADFNKLVKDFIAGRKGVDPWKLNTRALELAGYLPGDIIVLDMNSKAHAGDVVVAQIYDMRRGKAETVWRVYQPPYLVAASAEPMRFPPRDERDASIKGVMIAMFRPRNAQ